MAKRRHQESRKRRLGDRDGFHRVLRGGGERREGRKRMAFMRIGEVEERRGRGRE